MANHPLNLALRFLLEMAAVAVVVLHYAAPYERVLWLLRR